MKKFDVFIIGSGVAGTAIANSCAKKGLKVGVTDEHDYGGTCAMRGCIPKKVLWGATEVVEAAKRLKGKGIDTAPSVNWKELMAFKQTFVEPMPSKKETHFNDNGITTLHGAAKFISTNRLQIAEETVEARKIVIATGNTTRELDLPGQEHLRTSDDFLKLDQLPASMLFIGGGYIAFEFAHIAARCGVKVTILEQRNKVLANFEKDIVKHIISASKKLGIEIAVETEVNEVEKEENGFVVSGTRNGKTAEYKAELIFNTAGRVPNIAGLNLEKGGINYSKKGVDVNEFLQSVSNPDVYTAGDVSGSPGLPLTPLATMEAIVVADNITEGNHQKGDYSEMPTVVFTIPVMASVGLTEKQAEEKGLDFTVNSNSVPDWFSAKRINAEEYAFKIIIEKETEKILGAHLIGHHAEETINLFAMAMETGMKTSELKKLIYSFPASAADIQSMV